MLCGLAEIPAALTLLLLQEPGGCFPGSQPSLMEIPSFSITGIKVCPWEISLLLIYRSFNLGRPLSVLSIPPHITLHLLFLPLAGYGVPAPNISKRWKSSLDVGRLNTLQEGQWHNQPPQELRKLLKIWGIQIYCILCGNLASPASL